MGYFKDSIDKIQLDYLKVHKKNDNLEELLELNELDVDKKFEFTYDGIVYAYNPDRPKEKRFVIKYGYSCPKIKYLNEVDEKTINVILADKREIISRIEKKLGTCAFD